MLTTIFLTLVLGQSTPAELPPQVLMPPVVNYMAMLQAGKDAAVAQKKPLVIFVNTQVLPVPNAVTIYVKAYQGKSHPHVLVGVSDVQNNFTIWRLDFDNAPGYVPTVAQIIEQITPQRVFERVLLPQQYQYCPT